MCSSVRRASVVPAFRVVTALLAVLTSASCEDRPLVAPTSPASNQPTPGSRSGPVQILYLSAVPEPGATISGCGQEIAGCAGRVRMRFRLTPSATGTALFTRAWLFSTSQRACLSAEGGPLSLTAGAALDIEMPFDRADDCGVPLDVAHLAFVVEGPVQVASRQEWSVRYTFAR